MPEKLDIDNLWQCNKCEKHVEANKKIDLWNVPEILIIQLKRFKIESNIKSKNNTEIYFPIKELNLNKYLNGDNNIYNLYAISNH